MQQMINLKPLMTFKETMSYLRISRSTLLRWIADGQIDAHKVGKAWRFEQEDVQSVIDKPVKTEQGE